MAVASGLVSQVGFAEEVTPGTRVVPSRFFEFTGETLKGNRPRISSAGLRAGRVVGYSRWSPSKQDATGPMSFEVAPQGFGILFKHMIGPNVTTGAGPYVHTFASGGNLDGVTFTIQVGRPDNTGTVRPFDYLGMACTGWSLDAQVDAYLMLTMDFYGMAEVTDQTLATASYPATITPFTYLQGAVTIGGSPQDVHSITFQSDNALVTGRHQIRAVTPDRPKVALQGDRRHITGNMVIDFTDLTAYNRYVNGTEAALTLTFTSGTNVLTITANTRYDGETPSVTGPILLEQSLPFECVSSTSDAAAFTLVLTNGDATP